MDLQSTSLSSHPRAGILGEIAALLRAAMAAVAWRHRYNRDIAYLRALDDHALEDIGFTRGEIERLARDGC